MLAARRGNTGLGIVNIIGPSFPGSSSLVPRSSMRGREGIWLSPADLVLLTIDTSWAQELAQGSSLIATASGSFFCQVL